jgi:HK97 family phage prohead protease
MNEYKAISTRLIVKELDDEDGTIEGYGSVFNIEDQGGDVVLPGAFKKTLRAHKKNKTMPKMLWQHDPRQPIGKWTDIVEDDRGLNVRGRLLIDSDPLARTAHAHLQEKSIDGLSIGFVIDDYRMRESTSAR